MHCAQLLHTILHRTDLIIFPLTLQTITIAPMMSIWVKGDLSSGKSTFFIYTCQWSCLCGTLFRALIRATVGDHQRIGTRARYCQVPRRERSYCSAAAVRRRCTNDLRPNPDPTPQTTPTHSTTTLCQSFILFARLYSCTRHNRWQTKKVLKCKQTSRIKQTHN